MDFVWRGGGGEGSLPESEKSEAKESRQGHPQRREPSRLAGMKRQDFKRLKEGKPKVSEPKTLLGRRQLE